MQTCRHEVAYVILGLDKGFGAVDFAVRHAIMPIVDFDHIGSRSERPIWALGGLNRPLRLQWPSCWLHAFFAFSGHLAGLSAPFAFSGRLLGFMPSSPSVAIFWASCPLRLQWPSSGLHALFAFSGRLLGFMPSSPSVAIFWASCPLRLQWPSSRIQPRRSRDSGRVTCVALYSS